MEVGAGGVGGERGVEVGWSVSFPSSREIRPVKYEVSGDFHCLQFTCNISENSGQAHFLL